MSLELPPQFITGLILASIVLLGTGLVLYNLANAEPDVRTGVVYNKFLTYIESCLNKESDDCYCDDFEFTLIPENEYIALEQLSDNEIAVHLKKDNLQNPLQTAIIEGKQLCVYDYKTAGEFEVRTVNNHIITTDYDPYVTNSEVNYFLKLYQQEDKFCFLNYLPVPTGIELGPTTQGSFLDFNEFNYKLLRPQSARVPVIEKQLQKKHGQCSVQKKPEEDPNIIGIA